VPQSSASIPPRSQRHSPLHRSQRRVVHYGSVSPCLDFSSTVLTTISLNAAEQRELNSRMEKKQMKEFMTVYSILEPYQIPFHSAPKRYLSSNLWPLTLYTQMYSTLVQRCFDHCVNDFTTKSLVSREEGCVMRCVDKYLKSSERLGQRFQEQNAAMMQSGGLPGR
jgi:mitochondrial import inner membrane translocase subunit TIM9